MLQAQYDSVLKLLDEGKIELAVLAIENVLRNRPEPKWILKFSTLFLDCVEGWKNDPSRIELADLLITRTLQVYNKYDEPNENQLFFALNRAHAFSLRYDITYFRKRLKKVDREVLDYSKIDSIFNIEDYLTDSIKLYRHALKNSELPIHEVYSVRNNLAQALSRTGRYVEALELYEINCKNDPLQWQSFACYGDIMQTFAEVAIIPPTVSMFLNVCESYQRARNNFPHQHGLDSIDINMEACVEALRHSGHIFSDELVLQNRSEEQEQFQALNQYRQFVLNNYLALNEHGIYCKCGDAKVDDLCIGARFGSVHVWVADKISVLDGYVNRMLSEFGYSRFLYFNHVSGISTEPHDLMFSALSSSRDEVGYKVEQLRSSYRLIYGVLDKIMNGIFILYDLSRESDDYFESFFFRRRAELVDKDNIHLASLLSLAKELDQGNGIFSHFKKIRNQMEHDYLPIPMEDNHGMSLKNLEQFTFELLKLTRCAIFSFVFLIRTETFVKYQREE